MRFIVFGDSKGKEFGINEKVLTRIMKETCKLNPQPEFIVMCGDTVAGGIEEEVLTAQLIKFRKLIEKYHPTKLLLPVIGNHEVNIEPIDDRYEKILTKIYSDLNPDGYLQGYNKSVYYMDFGDTRLIILNAFHCGTTHKIDKEQLNWFRETVSADKKNKIVFVHSPAFPTGAHLGHCLDLYPEKRDDFWKIVDKCGVDIVFSGHEHNYSRRIIDSSFSRGTNFYKRVVHQIITGGGGEKLRDKYRSKEGIVVAPLVEHHFVIVDIDTQYIKVSALSLEGKILDHFKIYKP